MVSRGIWVKYSKCISKLTKISQATAVALSDINDQLNDQLNVDLISFQ